MSQALATWDERIAAAMKTGAFDEYAKRAAARWDTCAISERLSAIDRQHVALIPLRGDAGCARWHQLGLDFARAVETDDPREAGRILAEMREAPLP